MKNSLIVSAFITISFVLPQIALAQLDVPGGGTGANSLTQDYFLLGNGTDPIVASSSPYLLNAILGAYISGTMLPTANGGTNNAFGPDYQGSLLFYNDNSRSVVGDNNLLHWWDGVPELDINKGSVSSPSGYNLDVSGSIRGDNVFATSDLAIGNTLVLNPGVASGCLFADPSTGFVSGSGATSASNCGTSANGSDHNLQFNNTGISDGAGNLNWFPGANSLVIGGSANNGWSLDVQGSGNAHFTGDIYDDNNIFIGINAAVRGELDLGPYPPNDGEGMGIIHGFNGGFGQNGNPVRISAGDGGGGNSNGGSLVLYPGVGTGSGTSGNIGIGTSSPAVLLDIFSAGTTTLRLDNGSATEGSCFIMKDSDGVGYTYITANDGVVSASTQPCN